MAQLCGTNAVFYYSEAILSDTNDENEIISGMDSWLGIVYISIANFLSCLVIIFFLDKYGSKPLLLFSAFGISLESVVIHV